MVTAGPIDQGLESPTLTLEDCGEESAEEAARSRHKRLLPNDTSRYLWVIAVFNRAVLALAEASGEERYWSFLERYYQSFPIFDREVSTGPISGTELHFSRHLVNLEVLFEVGRQRGRDDLIQRGNQILHNIEAGMVESWLADDFSLSRVCHGVSFNELYKIFASAMCDEQPHWLQACEKAHAFLHAEHLQPHGVNSANEYLRGVGAFTATSYAMWLIICGQRVGCCARPARHVYGDHIEQAFFNAFPASIEDYQKHCYVFTPNHLPGVTATPHRHDKLEFRHSYSPPCCTGNLNRALPNVILCIARCAEVRCELHIIHYAPVAIETTLCGQAGRAMH